MQFEDVLANVQTQTSAFDCLMQLLLGAIKTFKDSADILFGNTYTCILNPEGENLVGFYFCCDTNGIARG
jgi:hypothetical protein